MTRTHEHRCETCGDAWVEGGPACCYDPVDQWLPVKRTTESSGAVLIQVFDWRGEEIIAGYREKRA